jgi:hypothetical protein
MINTSSISALAAAQFTSDFKKPLYDSYAYSLIPNTVTKLFTGEDLKTIPVEAVGGKWAEQDIVVLFIIDGFGWCFFEEYFSACPFLARFETQGAASKISSQFPSTTTAHISSICTGLEVGQSGLYEWFQYEPMVDRMISPLLFSFAGDRQVNTLSKSTLSWDTLFPFVTFFEALENRSISSYVVQQENIIHTPYSQAMYKGAHLVPYRAFRDGLEKSVELCQASRSNPAYIFIYFGDIDAAGHRHGIQSKEFQDAVDLCWKSIEYFWQGIARCGKRISVICTADHGMTPVDPHTTLYLNQEFPQIHESLQRNREGQPLVPAGSCRDFFLHVKEEQLMEMHRFLSQHLRGKADVFFVRDLIERGFFGAAPVSQRFMDRVGNLVLLPYHNESIWWYEKHHFEQNFHAAHGGLTPNEMESIFLYTETT